MLAVLISEIAARKKWISELIGRKLLHLFAGVVVLRIITIVNEQLVLTIIGLSFTIFLFVIIETGILKEVNSAGRKSWGIVLFPFSFSILVFFSDSSLVIAKLSFAIMTFSDSLAALCGILFAKKTYYLGSDKKSYLGSSIFFISTITILSIYFFITLSQFTLIFLIQILIISFILMIIEAISAKGSDNLFVPIFAAILIKLVLIDSSSDLQFDLIVGFILGVLTALLSIRYKVLTKDGGAATFILAFFIYGLGGFKWTIPIFVFFILSSILSKIRTTKNKIVDERFEKSGQRDANQVFANGAVGLVFMILYSFFPNELFYQLYVLYIAAMCADTWGTEIGTYFKNATYSIATLKEVTVGTSGGISVIGSIGAMIGAFIITYSSYYWLKNYSVLTIIASLAFVSSLIDSIMGATIQVQYKCNICKLVTEKEFHCETTTEFNSGIRLFNNDVVNFLSGVIILLIFYLLILFEAI